MRSLLLLLMMMILRCNGFSLLDLIDNDSNVTLHSIEPWTYRTWADVAIDSRDAWQRLSKGDCKRNSGEIVLVELKSFCFLPTADDLSTVDTPFILFGPFYDWHHVNFGPFSELAHESGANIFEARLSNKLAACATSNVSVSVDDIQRLLDHRALHSWVVQQHVRADLHHSKVRIMPIGFGYHGMRATDEAFKQINSDWREMAVEVLRENVGMKRDILLLTSFEMHSSLFGEGRGPRSELLRNLSAIPSLSHAATPRRFAGPRQYASALRRSKFVLSPWGWGPDCFRSYEAIALGAVPVILSDWAADQTLTGLPHLSVNHWSEIDEAMLLREYDRISKQSYSLVQLTQKFWTDRLFAVPSNATKQCNFNKRRRRALSWKK